MIGGVVIAIYAYTDRKPLKKSNDENIFNVRIESRENSVLKNNYLEEKSQNQKSDPYKNNIRQKIRDECARIVIFKIFASIAAFIVVIICLREMNGTRFFQ